MSVEAFHNYIVDGIDKLPNATSNARHQFYDNFRRLLRERAAGSPNAMELELALDTAIAAFEVHYLEAAHPTPLTAPQKAFVAPGDPPRSAGLWLWGQMIAGCATFGTVVDFLKPINSFETLVGAVSVALAILCTALIKLQPGRASLYKSVRTFAAAVGATMIGLFGLNSFIPGGAPNGVLAESFPPIAMLQESLGLIQRSSQATAENTATLVQQGEDVRIATMDTARNTAKLAEQGARFGELMERAATPPDLKPIYEKQIKDAGFEVDVAGLKRAFVEGGAGYASIFKQLGVELSADDIRSLLVASLPSADDTTAYRLVGTALGWPVPETQRALMADQAEFDPALKAAGNLTWLRNIACHGAKSSLADWIAKLFAVECQNEALWLGAINNRLSLVGRIQSFELDYTPEQVVVVSNEEFFETDEPAVYRFTSTYQYFPFSGIRVLDREGLEVGHLYDYMPNDAPRRCKQTMAICRAEFTIAKAPGGVERGIQMHFVK